MQKLLLVYYHSENPKSRHKPNLENTSKYGFSPDLGGKNGGVLSMRMQVILDSSFARPGSAPIWGGKKGEFRDWTNLVHAILNDGIHFEFVRSYLAQDNRTFLSEKPLITSGKFCLKISLTCLYVLVFNEIPY